MNELPVAVLYAGLAIGLVFGAVGLLSKFCSLSGLRGWWVEGDTRMIRSFALAMAVAIIATQALAAFGFVDLGKSLYLQPSFSPALILFGGLLFGYGMVLANGCASRAVVLIGQGNLRSLMVVIVIAVTAQMALKGLLGAGAARVAQLVGADAAGCVAVRAPADVGFEQRRGDCSRSSRGLPDRCCTSRWCTPACGTRLGCWRQALRSDCWSPLAGSRPAISATTTSARRRWRR